MFKRFLVALQFLTRICVKRDLRTTDEEFAGSAAFFPIVGPLVGGVQILLFYALDWVSSPSVTALLLLLAPIALTGAFHLEGLSDVADGFLSGRDREGMLRIMKDSHVGTMGAIVIVSLMLTKFVLLHEIIQNLRLWLIVGGLLFIPALSRWGMVITAGISQYARTGPGLGRIFTDGVRKRTIFLAGIVPVVAAIAYFRVIGVVCVAITILSALVGSWIAKRKINGVTGDVLGGVNEITEVILLLSIIILGKI